MTQDRIDTLRDFGFVLNPRNNVELYPCYCEAGGDEVPEVKEKGWLVISLFSTRPPLF
jgi:hypothetical protein